MGEITNVFVCLAVGTVGGFIGWRLKLSGGIIIGAMTAVILFKLLSQKSFEIPAGFRFFIQVLIGVMVGSNFDIGILPQMRALFWPVVGSTVVLMIAGLGTALLLARLNVLDVPTAYIATSPGAMNTLIGLAIDRGANATLVVGFHFFRLTCVNLSAPFIFAFLAWWFKK